jgi:DNA-binding MarR family transcriptional regulator
MHIMTDELNMSKMENCVCFNLRWVSRAVTRFYDAEMRRLGIRPTQTPILGALQAKDGWSMAELSEWLGMERTTLVRNLRPLEREGLVRANGGGRGGHVELMITAEGRKTLTKTLPAWRAAQDKVVAILGRERWSNLIHDLEQVATELKNQ